MPRCLVALGSNLGDRAESLARAVQRIAALGGVSSLVASRVHETRPIGSATAQGLFLNSAVAFNTPLSAEQLHAELRRIEDDLGRVRAERWAERTIDLDLLLYGDAVIDTPRLVLPHPRMTFRRFVLEPAAEVAGEMPHPLVGWTVARLLEHLTSARPYVALVGPPGSGKSVLAQRLSADCGGRFVADPAVAAFDRGVRPSSSRAHSPEYWRQIEFLECRARVLDRRRWPEENVLAVSDFYFDQALAYASLSLDPPENEAFCAAWRAARAEVVLPKLMVVIDTPRSARAVSHETDQASTTSDPLGAELFQLAQRRGLGPVLYVGRADPEAQRIEVSAAVEAMR